MADEQDVVLTSAVAITAVVASRKRRQGPWTSIVFGASVSDVQYIILKFSRPSTLASKTRIRFDVNVHGTLGCDANQCDSTVAV